MTETSVAIDANETLIPIRGDAKWGEYVISQLEPSDLKDGYPTCDGLSRLVNKLIGPIIENRIKIADNGNRDDRVVVKCCITVQLPFSENAAAYQHQWRFSDVAECSDSNTPIPYNKHPAATAATKAEGRTLRKILGIRNVFSYEESQTLENVDNNPISDAQLALVRMLCKRQNVDLQKLANLMFPTVELDFDGNPWPVKLEALTNAQAHEMIGRLNAFGNDKDSIPKEILMA